eukprot:GGOE01062199.1.p1 GENE.GGOE01062199.1~~GGOE01062199.1.p1  ORF type:complete len:797 (+),score=65.00 GGOE01062199.1:131-2392(+)
MEEGAQMDACLDGKHMENDNEVGSHQSQDPSSSPPLGPVSSHAKWCSWCLQKTEHRVTHQSPLQRAVCACTKCKQRTLSCRVCQTAMAKGHETWDDELCAKCNRAIRDWGVDVVHQQCQAWCSWCLENASHVLVQRNLMSRNVFKCAQCRGRTIPCIRCPDGMGRVAVGTTDLQCVKCCQPKSGRAFAAWESIARHVHNQFMICRAHNMDLHSVLMAPSSYRRKAFAQGLIRPFLLLVTMDPALRLSCAHLLGWSYATSDFCGDAHAEAWAILTRKRQGILARSQAFHEAMSNKLCLWLHVLQRALGVLAYSADRARDPGGSQALQWCQDPRFRVVEALERQLLLAICQCKRGQGEKVELYDAVLDELLCEAQTPGNFVTSDAVLQTTEESSPSIFSTPAPTSTATPAAVQAAAPNVIPTAAPALAPSSEAAPPSHQRTVSLLSSCSASSTSGHVPHPSHQRTASVLSNCSNLSTSARTALVVPVVTMESPAGVQGQGLDELDVVLAPHPTPPICTSPTLPAAAMDAHGWPRSASENVDPYLPVEGERDALRTFILRMADVGVTGSFQLSFALQVVIQLLDVQDVEGGIPPSLVPLINAAAPFATHGDPRAGGNNARTASPLLMVRWIWGALDLHAMGSQAHGQVLAVVTHLLNQKLLLAAQGFTLEAFYGPDHPSCQGFLSPLNTTGSQGSTPDTEESEGHFVGDLEGGTAEDETSQKAAAPPATVMFKSLGAKLESRMKGLLRGSGSDGKR